MVIKDENWIVCDECEERDGSFYIFKEDGEYWDLCKVCAIKYSIPF